MNHVDLTRDFWRFCLREVKVLSALLALMGLVLAPWVSAQSVVVEDWLGHQQNAIGVPTGWKKLTDELPFVKRKAAEALLGNSYDLEIVSDGPLRALRLRSANDHPIIVKDLNGVDLTKTPLLSWEWKMVVLPKGADLSKNEKSDSAAEILVVWKSKGQMLGFAWDETLPLGHRFAGPRAVHGTTVKFVVVGSGNTQLGQWTSVTRDVLDDYRKSFNAEPPGPPDRIAISIDSNQTHSTSESFIGPIRFHAR
jgi:hypothetical protein